MACDNCVFCGFAAMKEVLSDTQDPDTHPNNENTSTLNSMESLLHPRKLSLLTSLCI